MKVSEEVKVDEEVIVTEEPEVNAEIDVNDQVEADGETKVKKQFKLDKELLTRIMFSIGMIGAFVVGILFTLLCDISLKAASHWLMGGSILSFGCAVCAALSEMFREKRVLKMVLKGLAVALAVAFIGMMIGMEADLQVINKAEPKIRVMITPVVVSLIVLDAIAAIALVVDITMNALQKDE